MNYANMIEERRLKQGFIIATLISTIAGTFTTGINLYDRIIEKRKQSRLDRGQDQKIRALERRVDEAHGQRGGKGPRPDDLRESLERGAPLVQREYDQYAKLDPRFAQGDLTAQLQLQSQVITLQSTVIAMLEEALFTGKTPDISKLYNASEFAREGSIRALREQYRRMLEGGGISSSGHETRGPERALKGGGGGVRPSKPVRRISSTPMMRGERESSSFLDSEAGSYGRSQSRSRSRGGGRYAGSGSGTGTGNEQSKALVHQRMSSGGPLFCECAEELQLTGRVVDEILVSAGDGSYICSACGASLKTARHGSWRIEKEVTVREEEHDSRDRRETVSVAHMQVRTFVLTGRFLVKCHREETGFACCLCYRHRVRDTLCPDVESLVSHVAEQHYIPEYLGDPDIKEATRSLPIR